MNHFDPKLWSEIGARLREVRGKRGVIELLEAHELKGIHWHSVESGRKGLSVETLVKICVSMDVSPTWLLLGKGERKP